MTKDDLIKKKNELELELFTVKNELRTIKLLEEESKPFKMINGSKVYHSNTLDNLLTRMFHCLDATFFYKDEIVYRYQYNVWDTNRKMINKAIRRAYAKVVENAK